MPATHYANNTILNYQFHNTFPTTYSPYIGLSTTLIDENGLGAIEPSEASYSRQSGSVAGWNFDTEGIAYNSASFSFPTCEDTWGTIVEIFVIDNSASSILYHSKLSPSIPTYEGTQISINPQTLIINERI